MKLISGCLLASSLLLAGCATTLSASAAKVQDADNKMIAYCKFVGNVQGSSGWGNVAATTGMQNSKNEAMEEAATLGATHIVWDNISGGRTPFASGRAYKCE